LEGVSFCSGWVWKLEADVLGLRPPLDEAACLREASEPVGFLFLDTAGSLSRLFTCAFLCGDFLDFHA